MQEHALQSHALHWQVLQEPANIVEAPRIEAIAKIFSIFIFIPLFKVHFKINCLRSGPKLLAAVALENILMMTLYLRAILEECFP